MPDLLQRFIFEEADVRGEIVQLEQSYQQILDTHDYPPAVAKLLGEFLVAAALLSATIKFDGTITLQARSEGEIPLIMAEATSNHEMRGIAKLNDVINSDDFHQLLKDGQLCITIEPKQGKRYQGIVTLDGANLAECVANYFAQSEQLATSLWLMANGSQAGGLLLQELPADKAVDREAHRQQWDHLHKLTETISEQELLSLDTETLLYRLYHQDPVRIFEAEEMFFKCRCSRDRTAKALITLGQTELSEIIAEQGNIEINCEFCHQNFSFSQDQINSLFDHTLH